MKKYFIRWSGLFMFTFFFSICGNAQWVRTNLKYAGSVNDLTILGETLFAATDGGVYRSTDSGMNWVSVNNGLIYNEYQGIPDTAVLCFAVDKNTLFVGTWGDGVYHSTNLGNNWISSGIDSGTNNYNIFNIAVNNKYLFIAPYNYLFRSTDYGVHWNTVFHGLASNRVNALVISGNYLYAATGLPDTLSDGVYRSADNGLSWTALNNGLPHGIAFWHLSVNGNNLFVGSEGRGIYRSTDNGVNWVEVNSGITNDTITSILVINDTVFAGTFNGLFRSTNNGTTWVQVNDGLPSFDPGIFDISAFAISGGYIFASLGSGNGVLDPINSGVWRRPLSDFSNKVPTGVDSLAAVSYNNTISLTWQASTTPKIIYRVYRTLISDSGYLRIKDSILGTTVTDTGLTNGKQYFYVVRAFDPKTGLESANSNEVSGIPMKPDSGWADMRISLQSNKPSVVEKSGEQITYSIDYSNRGTEHAKNVEIVAVVPSNTQYVSGSAIKTGATTTLWFATQSGDIFGTGVQWTQTEPSASQITGIKWAIPDYAPDCKDCSSEVAFGVKLLDAAACGTTFQSQAQVRDGILGADIMMTSPFITSVRCDVGITMDAVSGLPNPIHYGEPFDVTLKIGNHGSKPSPQYSNLMLKVWNIAGPLAQNNSFLMAISDWMNGPSGHNPGDLPNIIIPSLQPGESKDIVLHSVTFVSLGVPLQDYAILGPDHDIAFVLTNQDFVSDPTMRLYLPNVNDQTLTISPSTKDAINCGMSLLTVASLGEDFPNWADAAKNIISFELGAKRLLDAASAGDLKGVADAWSKLILLIAATGASELNLPARAIRIVVSLWDGTVGCTKEMLYYLLYAGVGLHDAVDRASIFSPMYVSVQNPDGQITGFLPNDSIVRQIPNSMLWRDSVSNDADMVFQHSDTLDFQLYGYDSGAFTFVAGISLDSTHLLKVTFQDTSRLGMYAYFHYIKGMTKYFLQEDRHGVGVTDTLVPGSVQIIDTSSTQNAVSNGNQLTDQSIFSRIKVYPNPTTGIITVSEAPYNLLNVAVFNALGETVLELRNPHSPEFTLDLSKLIPGTYYIRFSSENSVVTKKVIRE